MLSYTAMEQFESSYLIPFYGEKIIIAPMPLSHHERELHFVAVWSLQKSFVQSSIQERSAVFALHTRTCLGLHSPFPPPTRRLPKKQHTRGHTQYLQVRDAAHGGRSVPVPIEQKHANTVVYSRIDLARHDLRVGFALVYTEPK